MIVRQSTHDAVKKKLADTEGTLSYLSLKYSVLSETYESVTRKYRDLQERWNDLVDKINDKGGMNFLNNGVVGGKQQLSDEDIKRLLQLVHPDKHGGKVLAVEMTQKLLALRSTA